MYVKITLFVLYIKSLYLNIQIILFFTNVQNFIFVKHYKSKKCKK